MDTLRHDLSESNMVFIHSDLDDAGLSMAAFRLFCHLSRRAGRTGLYPAAESMAEVCRMNRDTVWRGLAELEACGMLTRTARPGRSTELILQPPSRWRKSGGSGKEGVTPAFRQGVAEKEGRGVAEKRGHEDTPLKNIQEGDPSMAGAMAVGNFPGFEKVANVPRQIKNPAPESQKSPRPADACFEALVILQGSSLATLTKSERGRLNRALQELRAACPGLTPREIALRAEAYRAAMPGATLTASALAAHWSRLAAFTPSPEAKKNEGGAARHFSADIAAPAFDWRGVHEDLYDIATTAAWHQLQPYVREAILRAHALTSSPSTGAAA